ncbi:PREDICTED: uncharacterized protein LOC109170018 [Ipomoea nil]|uniref:uncharacterized protein LOC109170018 n=1 Tax=Ipomoea nil TaxID=35883 RepID=UPI0009014030|nr:PREDICTED: uncharacterized protein LOC109170018 [Ipomoea nil]
MSFGSARSKREGSNAIMLEEMTLSADDFRLSCRHMLESMLNTISYSAELENWKSGSLGFCFCGVSALLNFHFVYLFGLRKMWMLLYKCGFCSGTQICILNSDTSAKVAFFCNPSSVAP